MGLIKKAIAIGGIYYVAKKVHESHKESQNANANAATPQQQYNSSQPEQQPMTTSRAIGHQSYCNGQCGGQCSFNASEQVGYEAKPLVYETRALISDTKAPVYEEKAFA